MKRGRRSGEDLAMPRVDGHPSRLRPPAHLGADERRRFAEIVNHCDARHFRPSDQPLLCRFVESDALAEQAAAEMRRSGPVVDGKPSPWLTVHEKSAKAMTALALRLRLAPSARSDPKTVSRQSVPPMIRPWK